jgi:hypothetical protein
MCLFLECKSGHQRAVEVRVELVADPPGAGGLYHARPAGVPISGDDVFFASFLRVEPDLLRQEFVTNRLSADYEGCSIMSALRPHVSVRHAARICSSRQRPAEEETRSDDVTGAWQSMVRNGVASYDPVEDRFYHPPQPDTRAHPAP